MTPDESNETAPAGLPKVLMGWHATSAEVERAQTALSGLAEVTALADNGPEDRYGATAEELLEAGADADAMVTFVLPEDYVQAATDLRFVSWMHHGFDRVPKAALLRRGVKVANLTGDLGALNAPVCEQAWALLLACAKRLVVKDQGMRKGLWFDQWDPAAAGFEIGGKTLAMIGYGGIGRRIARVAHAFDARVLAIKEHPDTGGEGADAVYGLESLHEVLGQSDYVVLAVPLTRATYRLIDDDALAAMPDTCCVVNVGRGDLVDERAIYRALTEGGIAAYASDCWWDYEGAHPPGQHYAIPSRLGVHRLPNVVASGDQSANTLEGRDRILGGGIDNVRAFLTGDVDHRLVDLTS